MTHSAIVILAGLLPLYIVRFSVFGIPTNLFEVAVWVVAVFAPIGKTLGVNAQTPSVEEIGVQEALRTIPKSVALCISLFLFAAIISTAISPIPRSSIGILKGWVITPMVFGFLVYMVRSKPPIGKMAGVINSLVLSGLVVALFGLSQINGFTRIHSLYDVPNSLALFLVPIAIIALWIGIRDSNTLYTYAALVMLVAIIFTQSLGAIIALIGTMLIAMLLIIKNPLSPIGERVRVRATLLVFGFIIVTAIIFTLSGRFAYLISPLIHPNTTNSITVRMQLWDIGIDLIKKHPIWGIGLGQFEPAYQAELHRRFANRVMPDPIGHPRRQLQPEYVFRDPHNWIIAFWLNTGLLGLTGFIALNYIAIKRAFYPLAHIHSQAIALALISLLIFGLFDTVYWKNDLSALWWMLVAILLRHS